MPKCPSFRHFEQIKHVQSRDFDKTELGFRLIEDL